MKGQFLMISFALLLAGCSGGEPSQGSKDSWLMVLAQEAVEAKLKDPDSADFRDIKVHHVGTKTAVCGEVNAKNGFGGYTGFERFISAGAKELTFLESQMKAGEMNKAWDMFCRS